MNKDLWGWKVRPERAGCCPVAQGYTVCLPYLPEPLTSINGLTAAITPHNSPCWIKTRRIGLDIVPRLAALCNERVYSPPCETVMARSPSEHQATAPSVPGGYLDYPPLVLSDSRYLSAPDGLLIAGGGWRTSPEPDHRLYCQRFGPLCSRSISKKLRGKWLSFRILCNVARY
jgi:hypothetical protein